MTKRIGLHDTETGEIAKNWELRAIPRKKVSTFERWHLMNQDESINIAALGKRIGREGYQVLFYFLGTLDFENLIHINQSAGATRLHMARQSFWRATKRLIEANVIIEGPTIGKNRTYRLNPNIAWKGDEKAHKRAINERIKNSGLTIVKSTDPRQTDIEDFTK